MPHFRPHEINYVKWQNRATRFYLGARVCYLRNLHAPAAYCGVISLELLLKATLVYFDRSFNPNHFRHSMGKLCRAIRNKVPGGRALSLPSYFWDADRYLVVTRYPTGDRGVLVPASFLSDLDSSFARLLQLSPFQHNTELRRLLAGSRGADRSALTRANGQIRTLRRFLQIRPAASVNRPRQSGSRAPNG